MRPGPHHRQSRKGRTRPPRALPLARAPIPEPVRPERVQTVRVPEPVVRQRPEVLRVHQQRAPGQRVLRQLAPRELPERQGPRGPAVLREQRVP